jgi:hypothetical protein
MFVVNMASEVIFSGERLGASRTAELLGAGVSGFVAAQIFGVKE